MNLGFETIGNASVIVFDLKPLLTTDPWISDSAYFGSWRMSHEIPAEQLAAIKSSEYIWFSHGHPDHLNPDSLGYFKTQKILLPNHVGKRIETDLRDQGFTVTVLPDRKWQSLSNRVRVMCICDYFQDAILLIDVDGCLLINTNDASDRGWGRFARRVAKPFKTKILLALFGYGDADMINFYDESGAFIEPKAAKRIPVGKNIAAATASWEADLCVPFSSMHHYQRSDSIWANKYVTNLDDYRIGFNSKTCELTPAFISYDCESKSYTTIDPPARKNISYEPSDFGDDWNETLTSDDVRLASEYFLRVRHLSSFLDFVNLRVGGHDNIISLAKKRFNRGLTFEVPRHSLMNSIEWGVFDDLLIGNFMKTHLHGKWSKKPLYPDFTPYVTRYGDNAKAFTEREIHEYFEEYKKRAGLEFVLHKFESKMIDSFRARIQGGSKLFEIGKKVYWRLR